MGVYFGTTLSKTGPKYRHYRANFGPQPIFILEDQFSDCNEFQGWYEDLSIEFMERRKILPFLYLPTPPPKLVRRQTDDVYLVLASYLQDKPDYCSYISRPEDQLIEMPKSYMDLYISQNALYDVVILKAQNGDMFYHSASKNARVLYVVTENGVKVFTSKTLDGLHRCVLSDEAVPRDKRVEFYLKRIDDYRCWSLVDPISADDISGQSWSAHKSSAQ